MPLRDLVHVPRHLRIRVVVVVLSSELTVSPRHGFPVLYDNAMLNRTMMD